MSGLFVQYCGGHLEIEGQTAGWISMMNPAWCVLDATELWEYGSRRGKDRVLPGASGVRAYRRRKTATTYSLPMPVWGEANRLGVAYPDVETGFETNYDFLVDQLVTDPGTTAGTRNARLTRPSGAVKTGPVHVLAVPIGVGIGGRRLCTLELSIPGGRLT